MIEIIKKPETFITTCSECKAVVKYNASDVTRYVFNEKYIKGELLFIECPSCKNRIKHFKGSTND